MDINTIRKNTKIFDITLFDFILTYIAGYLVYTYTSLHKYITYRKYYASLIPLSVFVHIIFKQETGLIKGLKNGNNLPWFILILSFYFILF